MDTKWLRLYEKEVMESSYFSKPQCILHFTACRIISIFLLMNDLLESEEKELITI